MVGQEQGTMNKKKPIFSGKDECSGCQFLGSALFMGKMCDYYKCVKMNPSSPNDILIQYGEEVQEYCSGSLFVTRGLTRLEKAALSIGFPLTRTEKEDLLLCLMRGEAESWDRDEFNVLNTNMSSPEDMEESTMNYCYALGDENLFGFESLDERRARVDALPEDDDDID